MGLFKKPDDFKSRTEMGILTTMILFGQYDGMYFSNDGWDGESN